MIFMNIAAVFGNGGALLRAGKMPEPQGGNPSARLDPGRPMMFRPGVAVFGAIIALAILVIAFG